MSELNDIVGQDVDLAADQGQETGQTQETQQAEPAQGQETAQEGQQAEQQQETRTVPLAALHEERQRRKELAQEVQRIKQEQAQRDQILEQRLAALTQARQQEQVPQWEENPAEHLRHQLGQVQQTQQQTAQQLQQWQQNQMAQARMNHLAHAVVQHEAAFVQQTPDYVDAVQYLLNQRAAELMVDGSDEYAAKATAAEELRNLALTRAHSGRNPAEDAYKLAKARGYTAKQAQQAATAATAADKLQTQQRGVAASRGIGSGGGNSGGKLSLEALASMSNEDFAEATKGGKWDKLMGS